MWITPVYDFGLVDTMLVGIMTTFDLLIAERFLRMSADVVELRHTVNHIDR